MEIRTQHTGIAVLAAGDEPPLAAHLVSPRRGYLHHGLYVGGGRVIHYGGLAAGWRRGPVEEVSLARFSRGRGIWVRARSWRKFEDSQVIRRARRRLGEDRYRLFSNNCEHFCEWCVRGESRSRQIERLHAQFNRVASAFRHLGRSSGSRLLQR